MPSGRDTPGIRLFLCGDLMTGRGIDQILPHPSAPQLFESAVRSATGYVELAERVSGPIPRSVGPDYVWGDALAELERQRPHVRIVNLETAVTRSDDAWPDKGIHYRMHPANVGCLTAARIDCCALANNHVLDWGRAGLAETLETLHGAGVRTAGAGRDEDAASHPAILETVGGARILVFAAAHSGSGVPDEWRARAGRSGVHLLPDYSARTADRVAALIALHRRAGDAVVLSIHWGGNWGYGVSREQRDFARRLIEARAVDVVHGHSSHHPKGIEVHRGKLILYGCGDLLNDYEGIGGYEAYRGDLALMYFATIDRRRADLAALTLVPVRTRRFRLERAPREAVDWLGATLARECAAFGTRVAARADDAFELELAG